MPSTAPSSLPPLPPGAKLIDPSNDDDPYDILKREGFTFTNGYRATGDTQRLRAEGYKPADNSLHLDGDAVDLQHPTLSPAQQAARLNSLFGGWQGFKVLDEGDHRHLQLPGWHSAPGTPGTAHSGLPPLPPGATLYQRGKLTGNEDGFLHGTDVTQLQMQTIDKGTEQGDWSAEEGNRLKANIAAGNALHPDGNVPIVESQTVGWKPADLIPEVAKTWAPEQLNQYLAVAADPNSTADQLRETVKGFGFVLGNADEIIAARNKGMGINRDPVYREPKPLAAPEGTIAAAGRGALDAANLLDEYQAIRGAAGQGLKQDLQGLGTNPLAWVNLAADTLLPQSGETIFDGRSFGDIVNRNIDLNRARLEQDARDHYLARMTGQIVAGSMVPLGAANRARDVAKIAGIEGAVTGFGAGEGNPLQRLPAAAGGAAIGATGGYAVGTLLERIGIPAYRALRQRFAGATDEELEGILRTAAMNDSAPVINDGAQNAGPTNAARTQGPDGTLDPVGVPQARAVAMGAEFDAPTLSARVPDRIDVSNLPPLPPGATLLDEPQLGRVRPMSERASPDDIATLAQGVNPEDVTPLAPNNVESLDEFERATGGVQRQLEAPNEFDELGVRKYPSKSDLFKSTSRRGPLDMTMRLRQFGGVNDEGGDLAHLGITNDPRNIDFARNEQFLGRLVHPEGMSLDDAAFRLWEDGYFPDFPERPTPADLLDHLHGESTGAQRHFRPDDLDEVARFEAARAERGRIETAAQEGAPLYDDIGESINLDDLASNQPPANAYEDSPRLVGKIGNINLAHIENPADVSRLIQQVQNKVGGFDAARRGAITHEETRLLADELGMRPEDILKRRQGQAVNAEQLYAMRVTVQKSREVVARLAKRAVGGSDEDLARFRNAWMRHVAIEEQVSGATAEVGRAMSQFRMLSRGGDAKAEAVRAYLKGGGGRETIEDAAQKLVDMMEDPAQDAGQASKFMREAAKARTWDKVQEVWINSLLSGPKTHIVNFLGNALVAAYHLPEQALTAGIGAALRTPNRTTMREVATRAAGMIEGARDGLRLAKHAWKTGEPLDAVSKVEARNYQAIPGRLGTVIRTPTRALTAADEFWKAINRRAATNAMAFRRAYAGAGTAEEKAQRFADLVANPDESLRKYADNEARYYTFQAPLGTVGQKIQAISNTGAWKFVIPFVRTPANILKFAGERSIFAPLMGEFRAAIKAGGNARNEALARLTIGSGLSAWAVSAAADGRISGGGPSDPEEKAALLNSGWQPYSFRVGDEWISYQRFEPISLLIGVAADYADAARSEQASPKELNELATGIGAATAKNITSKTWLSGLSDFFDMLSDPDRYGRQYAQRLVSSMAVPAIVAHTASAIDPNLRDARTMLDAIKARVPGLSFDVAERLNVWGEPIKRGSGAGTGPVGDAFNFVSPVYTSTATSDPILREAGRLRVQVKLPQRSLTIDGKRVPLSADQYHVYVQLAGRSAKQEIVSAMQSPDWKLMADDDRRKFIRDTFEETRAAARDQLKTMFPALGLPGGLPPLPPGATMHDGSPAPSPSALPPLPAGAALVD